MKLFEELNRRKVLKTLGIYIVVAWGLLQFVQIVADIWLLPEWIKQAVFVVLVAGVPVAALASWLFDVTREGIVADDDRWLSVMWHGGWRKRSVLIGGIGAMLLALLALIPYLWPDDVPNEDVRRLSSLVNQRSTDPMALAYALHGFSAEPGRDMWQYGRHRISTFNALGITPDDAPILRFTLRSSDLCSFFEPGCLDDTLAALEGVPALLAANRELLDRYRDLHRAGDFTEVTRMSFDSPLPLFQQVVVAHRLILRQALLGLREGDPTMAYWVLEEDLAFHRRMLAGANNLIMKMIAVNLVSEGVRARVALAPLMSEPLPPVSRLIPEELAMIDVWQWEAIAGLEFVLARDRAYIAGLHSWDSKVGLALFRTLPFKPYRTANYSTTQLMDAARLSLLSYPELVAETPNAARPRRGPLERYVNGAGYMMFRGNTDFLAYVWRVRDLDALIVLSRIAHHLDSENVPESAIPGVLLSLPPELRSPYDGSPARYDDGVLRFTAVGPESGGRRPLELALPRTAGLEGEG